MRQIPRALAPALLLLLATAAPALGVWAPGIAAVPGVPACPLDLPADQPRSEPFSVTASDGTALRGHVYFPPGPGPFAVVLLLSPYWGQIPGGSGCFPVTAEYPFVQHGFAFALMGVRGTGESDGCIQFGTALDRSDAGAIVEALAAAPWSTGMVGAFGGSFDGEAAMTALASGAPSLKAVVTFSGVVDWWNENTRGGAAFFPAQGPVAMPAPLAMASFVPGTGFNTFGLVGPGLFPSPVPWFQPPPISHAACPIYADHVAENAQLLALGDRNAYWDARDQRPALAGTRVPVLWVDGLRNFEESVLQTNGLWDLFAGDKRFVLGQWQHLEQPASVLNEDAVAWMDHYLRGGPAVPVGFVRYQDDVAASPMHDPWHEAARWPPAAPEARLFLTNDQLVPDAAEVLTSSQTFVSAWANPCMGLCTPQLSSFEQGFTFVASCGYNAMYVSPPLAHDVTLAGNFRVRMTLTSPLPLGHVAAFLYHSTTGACPDAAAKEVRRAIANLRDVRDPHGEAFPTDTPTSFTLESYPFAAVVPAGERLVLCIGGEAGMVVPSVPVRPLTVSTGQGRAAELDLPVAEGTLDFA